MGRAERAVAGKHYHCLRAPKLAKLQIAAGRKRSLRQPKLHWGHAFLTAASFAYPYWVPLENTLWGKITGTNAFANFKIRESANRALVIVL